MGSVVHPWCYSVLLLAVLLNISTINPGIQRDDPELLTGEQGFLIRNYYTTHFYIQVYQVCQYNAWYHVRMTQYSTWYNAWYNTW